MINIINEALEAVRIAAADQSHRMQNELNSALDAINIEKVNFSINMQNVAKLRAEADRQQGDAMRAFDTAFSHSTAILVALKTQIGAGEIVTGSETPVPRLQPKLKSVT